MSHMTGLKKYSTSENPKYPVPGDVDIFSADCPDPIEVAQGKVKVKTLSRWLSVFESQLRPIADYFEDHPTEKTVKVKWIESIGANGRPNTVASTATKL